MPCRTEQKFSGLSTERPVLHIYCNRIRRFLLECERYIIADTIPFLVLRLHFRKSSLEKRLILRRYRKYHIGSAISIAHIVLCLHQMLGKCGAALSVRIPVETEHSFRFGAVS